jgi:N-carbamoylputrescine amidase
LVRTRTITVAAVQAAYGLDMAANIAKTEALIRAAASKGAQVILAPELFQGIYFPTRQDPKWFATAYPAREHPAVLALQKLAGDLNVVIPISFFEKHGQLYYNSVALADAGGEILGLYRKSHIPDGPGYQEKYYFRPGDTGFKAWHTKHGTIGVGICWDQWYPEAARAMVLDGAEVLLYPTAVGSDHSHEPWQRAMQGHAAANAVPVVAANRIGREENDGAIQEFYGHSFIADQTGDIVEELGEKEEGVIVHSFDLEAIAHYRADWGFFRDRRTDLYAKSLF